MNIGFIYFDQGNYELAMEYVLKGLKTYEKLGDKKGLAKMTIGLGKGKKLFDKNLNPKLKQLNDYIEDQNAYAQLVTELIDNLEFEDSESKEKQDENEKSNENSSAPEKNDSEDSLSQNEEEKIFIKVFFD